MTIVNKPILLITYRKPNLKDTTPDSVFFLQKKLAITILKNINSI